MPVKRRDPVAVVVDALASSTLNAVIGIASIAIPIIAWISARADVKNDLLVAETVVVILLTVNHLWIRRAFIMLRRANNLKAMDDPKYYDEVRGHLESELISDYGEIADGHLQVYASEVPRLSALLVRTLISAQSEPKRVLAADLTTNPGVLTQRHEYLTANRRLIESGGTIQRLFIVYGADLVDEEFARLLLKLITQHRQLGVTCGLAVRDRLRADQAVDVVVIGNAAALVEEEQGDVEYTKGRSSVYFKNVERWAGRLEALWGHGSDAAPMVLQTYEAVARPMLDASAWDAARARDGVDQL